MDRIAWAITITVAVLTAAADDSDGASAREGRSMDKRSESTAESWDPRLLRISPGCRERPGEQRALAWPLAWPVDGAAGTGPAEIDKPMSIVTTAGGFAPHLGPADVGPGFMMGSEHHLDRSGGMLLAPQPDGEAHARVCTTGWRVSQASLPS